MLRRVRWYMAAMMLVLSLPFNTRPPRRNSEAIVVITSELKVNANREYIWLTSAQESPSLLYNSRYFCDQNSKIESKRLMNSLRMRVPSPRRSVHGCTPCWAHTTTRTTARANEMMAGAAKLRLRLPQDVLRQASSGPTAVKKI